MSHHDVTRASCSRRWRMGRMKFVKWNLVFPWKNGLLNMPWDNWQHVMASCWNKDPKLRLTAQKRGEQLQPWRLSREYITATRIYESFITTTTTTNPKAFNAITTITTPKSSSLLGPKRNQSQTRKSPKGLLFHIIVKPKTGMCILSKKGVGNGIPITST